MIRIFKTGLSYSSDSPEVLTVELGQQTSPGRRGFGPKSSGHRSPGGGASILLNKRLTLPFLAFVAALAVALGVLLAAQSAVSAQTVSHITYPEDSKDAVATLTASDPERVGTTVWDLLTDASDTQDITGDGNDNVDPADIEDNADFKISDAGVLEFMTQPDFENPADASPTDNIYRVTVRASDGTTGETRGWYKVVVTVTDVEEQGKITWSVDPASDDGTGGNNNPVETSGLLQFQPGAVITPTLTDDDGSVSNLTWQWSGEGTVATNGVYTVTDSNAVATDVNKRLTVTAMYDDRRMDGQTATLTLPNPVQVRRDVNTAPEFGRDSASRTVSEGAMKGADVGAEVEATDEDADKLTYSLGGDNADDVALFDIDEATGQLMVDGTLNFDVADGNSHTVTVTATDSMGATDTIDVTISVTNVNEDPTLTTLTTTVQKVGRIERAENETALDGDASTPESVDAANFTGSDPEGGTVELSTSGTDGDMFKLTATEATNDGYTETLAFKANPDFEMPGDANGDNIYEVTVVATDGNGNTAEEMVTVKVTNIEEAGEVTLPGAQPQVDVAMTATLADSDIFSPDTVTWQWYRSGTAEIDDNTATCTATTTAGTTCLIDKAMSATYTPVDGDVGENLRAKATYFDMTYAGDDDLTTAGIVTDDDRFKNMATSDPSIEVSANAMNRPPKFSEGSSTERFVRENTDEAMGIGDPVTATDPDGETPTYSLGGADAASFDIDASDGQLETKADLDYETKKKYSVTVTATDSTSNRPDASALITVTIMVTNVDEAPMVTGRMTNITYPEDSKDAVATLTASDPERVGTTVWDLLTDASDTQDITGDGNDNVDPADIEDNADFKISDAGVLEFMTQPDFENPADASPTDNIYRVTVRASDGTTGETRGWYKVVVTVTDVEEQGKITWSVDPASDDGTGGNNNPVETLGTVAVPARSRYNPHPNRR